MIAISQDKQLHSYLYTLITGDLECEGACKLFNQFLHCVLFVPAFPAEIIRSGTHLESLFEIKAQRLNSSLWNPIKGNQNPRYHFLPSDTEHQIPDLVLDFKAYYTLSYKYFLSKHKACYLATVNELFRERLSQRFANYLNRIGLPNLPLYDNL